MAILTPSHPHATPHAHTSRAWYLLHHSLHPLASNYLVLTTWYCLLPTAYLDQLPQVDAARRVLLRGELALLVRGGGVGLEVGLGGGIGLGLGLGLSSGLGLGLG